MLSMSQAFTVADSVPARYRAMVLLATFTSLRWGEIAGLRRKNIDLKACTVRVETTVIELGGTLLTDQAPKSEAGRRVVAFPDQLRPVLVAHLWDYAADDPDAYVFTSPRGSVLRCSNFRDGWIKATAAAGVPGVRSTISATSARPSRRRPCNSQGADEPHRPLDHPRRDHLPARGGRT